MRVSIFLGPQQFNLLDVLNGFDFGFGTFCLKGHMICRLVRIKFYSRSIPLCFPVTLCWLGKTLALISGHRGSTLGEKVDNYHTKSILI